MSSPAEQKYSRPRQVFDLIRHHVGAPVLEVLDAADLDGRIVNVDPVVREQLGAIDDHRHGDEVPILEIARRLLHGGRRAAAQAPHQMRQRHRRDDVRGRLEQAATVGVLDLDAANGVAVVRDGGDARVQEDRSAELLDPCRKRFPHHPGTQTRIFEFVNQRLDLAARPAVQPRRQHVDDGNLQRQALDPLGGPPRADGAARNAPHFLGVGLEEQPEQLSSEAVRDPVLEADFRIDGPYLDPQVAGEDRDAAEDPQVEQGVRRFQRIVEEFPVEENARQPWPGAGSRRRASIATAHGPPAPW